MNNTTLPGATASVTPNLQRFLDRLSRGQIAALAQAAIDRLDDLDGDSDLEDASDVEDDFALSPNALVNFGAGCPISDPGGGNVEDEGEQQEPFCQIYGINQAAPVSDSNPAFG